MGYSIRWTHVAATAIAVACVGYQTAVIWESLSGVSTITKLGVPLATVSAALLPVLAEAAWREGAKLQAGLLLLPVVVLLAFVLPSGVSRLGESQEQRRVAAQTIQADQAKLRADLAKADKLVTEAEAWAAAECKSGAGKRCAGVTFTLNQRQAFQRELAGKVEAAKPATKPWLPDWHPATLPIGLELCAWAALFFGLGPFTHTRAPVQAITERDVKVEPITDSEIAELRRLLRTVGRPVNNSELARLAGISDGECSKRVADAVAAGVLRKERDGRQVAITLH